MKPNKAATITSSYQPTPIDYDGVGYRQITAGAVVCAFDTVAKMACMLHLQDATNPLGTQSLEKLVFYFLEKSPRAKIQIKMVGASPCRELVRSFCKKKGISIVAEADADAKAGGQNVYFSPATQKIKFGPSEPASEAPIGKLSVAPRKKRVFIVDDSKTMRTLLRNIFSRDPGLEVVGDTGKPMEAEGLIAQLKPDVITLDIHMPEMDGITLLKILAPKFSIPVVMISSINYEEGTKILNALELGAVDYIEKPSYDKIEAQVPMILEKIRVAAEAKPHHQDTSTKTKPVASQFATEFPILIGSSTGGTEALRILLTALPKDIPPILIVQHIPAVFSLALANRLNELCDFEVKEAKQDDIVQRGQVLIAPGGLHMTVRGSVRTSSIVISDTPKGNLHVPSVDVLFDSAARTYGPACTAVILTGMGRDGAEAMLKLRKLGAHTVAQNQATSVVYGMPKAAIDLGAVDVVLGLEKIAGELLTWTSKKKAA